MSNSSVYIVAAQRTQIGKKNGGLKKFLAHDLGSHVIKSLIKKINLEPKNIDEVIMGQVLTGNQGQNPARQAAINAGVPVDKTAYIINQVCGSGLRSVASAYQSILLGEADIVLAGGQESMSNTEDEVLLKDGLVDAFGSYHMGITAENVAEKWQITRAMQDEFSINSQSKALKAMKENKFKDEIAGGLIDHDDDEHPRTGLTLEKLSQMNPVFKKDGTVTVANSSGINDGAAGVVVMSEKETKKRNLKPLAKIISWATSGVEPAVMGTGPIPASKKALSKAGWTINDVDLVEANEAFAAQSLAVMKELNISKEKLNVNGGAIALGHPIGATGTRILVTLIHEMKRRKSKKGLATLCIGGGMGISMCIENVI